MNRQRLMLVGSLVALVAAGTGFPLRALAYERDIHYYGTFAIAVAVGWRWADAMVIASANQGVDENKETVAALESSASIIPALQLLGVLKGDAVHQAARNFDLHSFSRVPGDAKGIAGDVRVARDQCRKRVADWISMNGGDNVSPAARTRLLIAVGVYLHCVEDMGAHQGYGGSCFTWRGSCTAHVWDSYIDDPGKRTNPDHPWVKPARPNLAGALGETSRDLSLIIQETRQVWKSRDEIPQGWIDMLVDRFRSKQIAELPDDKRIACHREVAGAWLSEYLESQSKWGRDLPQNAIVPISNAKCKVRNFGGAKTFVAIPEPAYPSLDPHGRPRRIDPRDGSYGRVRNAFDLAVDSVESTQECTSFWCRFHITIQVVNLGPSSSESSLVLLAVIPRDTADNSAAIRVQQKPLAPQERSPIKATIESPAGARRLKDYVVYADIQPARSLAEEAWNDGNVGNDSLGCTRERCERQRDSRREAAAGR